MKGTLKYINGKWFIEYYVIMDAGVNPRRLELIPNDQRYLNCFSQIDNGTPSGFKQVLLNPMGREVNPNNLGQNHSGCVWYAKLVYEEEDLSYITQMGNEVSNEMVRATMIPKEYFGKEEQKQHLINIMKGDEELGLYEDMVYEDTYTNKEIRTWWLDQTEERRRNMVREYFKGGNSERINTLYGIMPEEMEEMYNINVDVVIMDWEEILFDFIDFYPCQLPDELFEWLKENYEIPKKKD